MSDVVLGKLSDLQLGATAAGVVSFTGRAAGTETISALDQRNTRPVPGGRGVLITRLGAFRQRGFTLRCDSNDVHDPVLRTANGGRRHFVWRKRGAGAGLPESVGECVATTVLTFDVASDAVTWDVRLAVDRDPTTTPQP